MLQTIWLSGKVILHFFVIGLLIFTGKALSAQSFNASLSGGLNWSQMSLLQDGLNRPGKVFCLSLYYQSPEKPTRWNLGLLYRESGFSGSFNFFPDAQQKGIKLQWAELPISLSFVDWQSRLDQIDYFKMQYSFGLSPARLLRVEFIEFNPAPDFPEGEVKAVFRNYNLNWFIEAAFFPHPNWSVNLQFSRSALSLLDTESAEKKGLGKIRQSLLSTTLAFHL